MKYCRDCKHYYCFAAMGVVHKACYHESARNMEGIHTEPLDNRMSLSGCGEEARYFEPRPPVPPKPAPPQSWWERLWTTS